MNRVGLCHASRRNLGGLLLLLSAFIYSLAFLSPLFSVHFQRVRYDENPPSFPRIAISLIREVRMDNCRGLGVAESTFASGRALYSKSREIPAGELICPYGGKLMTSYDGAGRDGDYLIQVGNIIEDGAELGLGGLCNDRLTPEDNNSDAVLHRGRIWLRANQHIMPGDEITLSYGWWYWSRRLNRIPVANRSTHFSKLIELSRFYCWSNLILKNKSRLRVAISLAMHGRRHKRERSTATIKNNSHSNCTPPSIGSGSSWYITPPASASLRVLGDDVGTTPGRPSYDSAWGVVPSPIIIIQSAHQNARKSEYLLVLGVCGEQHRAHGQQVLTYGEPLFSYSELVRGWAGLGEWCLE